MMRYSLFIGILFVLKNTTIVLSSINAGCWYHNHHREKNVLKSDDHQQQHDEYTNKKPSIIKRLISMKNTLYLRGGVSSVTVGIDATTTSSSSSSSSSIITNSPPLALSCSHWMSKSDCLDSLQVTEQYGLSSIEFQNRLNKYGLNKLPNPPIKSLWKLILEQFNDRLVQILLAVAMLSGILAFFENDIHAFIEPFIIITILIINSLVGIIQNKSAENSLDALKKLQPEYASVLRDGIWYNSIQSSLLVPGDIIYLRVGDKIPADCRIITLKTNTFSTDEGSLTGESATVFKTTDPVDALSSISGKLNMVFSGTVVTNGACHAVVTGTGTATEIGLINAGVQAAKEDISKTPLVLKLDEFGDQLTIIIGCICLLVWFASIPKFNHPIFGSTIKGALYYAKVSVALGVAAIPEGLPAVISLCLALGTSRMAKKNVIVRKLSSVETLGCTSVICTDKTGTLTTNKMTVKSLITCSSIDNDDYDCDRSSSYSDINANNSDDIGNYNKNSNSNNRRIPNSNLLCQERFVDGVSYNPIGEISNFTPDMMNLSTMKILASICSLCNNNAHIEYKDNQFQRVGEPTEVALKVLVEKLGVVNIPRSDDLSIMAHQYNDIWNNKFKVLSILEFNRDRKSMSVLVKCLSDQLCDDDDDKGNKGNSKNNEDRDLLPTNYLFVKGASEMIIQRCNRIQLENGKIIKLTDELKEFWLMKAKELAMRPLRCLGLAYKYHDDLGSKLNNINTVDEANQCDLLQDNNNNYLNIENDMILIGICGIKDPARPEVANAILKCAIAGIRVMMITGDSKETAIAIAKDVNIFDDNNDLALSNSFTSKEFFEHDYQTQLDLLRTGNKVFCRAEPKDKQKLITMLDELNEIIAMTGDGVNDAPALQQANIGIAMGITGTEVAKSASDMILADDNFATIVNAVEEGRNIYTNMQTFISFLISCNIGEVITIFLATILGIPEPLTPLHLLWVNLITDGPPATALGYNPSDPTCMNKKPRSKNESILSKWLLIRYVITGCYVGFATVAIFTWWYMNKGVTFTQLMNWSQCNEWENFAHSAEAPFWPKQPCDIFTGKLKSHPQSLSLSVLVMIEMLKALSAVSLESSLFTVQPWQNPWLIISVIIPLLLHALVLYTPSLNIVFGLSPLTTEEWKMVLLLSLPILLIEEILKFIGRNLDYFKSKTNYNITTSENDNNKTVTSKRPSPSIPHIPAPMF